MKKSIALVALAFGVTSAFAQDLTSKKGEPFLPEAGDWSIGLDASPFLRYAGNFFGKTAPNAAPTWDNYGLNNTIVGKKFKDANTAYRGIVRIGFRNDSYKKDIATPQSSTTTPPTYPSQSPTGEDKLKRSSTTVGIGVGIEKRRGKTRLQGFYGADVFIWYTSTKDKYTYANGLTQGTADPNVGVGNSTDWSGTTGYANVNAASGVPNGQYPGSTSFRILQRKPGGQIGVGVRAFIGAEYFIAPKISIGGEFGWGIGFAANTKTKTKYETEGTTPGGEATATIDVVQKNGTSLILDTDRNAANSTTAPGVANTGYNFMPSGTIRLNLHF